MNSDDMPLKIIERLKDVQKRPGIYLGTNITIEKVIAFLNGFDIAFQICNLSRGRTDDFYQLIINKRGWSESSTRGIWNIMRDHQLQENEIIQELIAIEIEVWEQRYRALQR